MPVVKSRLSDVRLPAGFRNRRAIFRLLLHERDLSLRELASLNSP